MNKVMNLIMMLAGLAWIIFSLTAGRGNVERITDALYIAVAIATAAEAIKLWMRKKEWLN